jgi:hypothetical protein
MSSDERKRRGIDRTAAKLRESVVKNGGRDPGFDKCRDRVRDARIRVEQKRNK